jgi:hypothetical protein
MRVSLIWRPLTNSFPGKGTYKIITGIKIYTINDMDWKKLESDIDWGM